MNKKCQKLETNARKINEGGIRSNPLLLQIQFFKRFKITTAKRCPLSFNLFVGSNKIYDYELGKKI